MHEAKLLAEGGFKGSERMSLEQRYERAEKDLFTRMEGLGREIENRVTGNDSSRLKDQGLKAETTSAADYGSAEHHEKFAGSPANFRRQRKPDSRPPSRGPKRGDTPHRSHHPGLWRRQGQKDPQRRSHGGSHGGRTR